LFDTRGLYRDQVSFFGGKRFAISATKRSVGFLRSSERGVPRLAAFLLEQIFELIIGLAPDITDRDARVSASLCTLIRSRLRFFGERRHGPRARSHPLWPD
jgi:hypothetical protein